MKAEYKLFGVGVVFYLAVAALYAVMSRENGAPEPAGTTALVFTGGLALLISFYLFLTGRRVGDRPEDRLDADIDEGAGEIGFFSPHSVTPLLVGGSAAVVTLGIVFGHWLVFLGVLALGFSVIAMVFEYYRGEHAH